ncbi:MAG: hypothetical protein GY793_06340 [Proteobacteria bacterium]|nr:hypothetical protein [Pseudomonadota bacterium]
MTIANVGKKKQCDIHVVSSSKIYKGLKVVDKDKNIGTVKQCFDMHNVWVVYDVGGSGFYCIEKDCKDYDPIYYS